MSQFKHLLEAFLFWEKQIPNADFLRLYHQGKLEVISYREAGNQIRKIVSFIDQQELKPKSKIGILSKNCPHWVMADLAIMMSGHISVPLYPTLKDQSLVPILTHSECQLVFVGKLDDFSSQKNALKNILVIGTEKYGISGNITWEHLLREQEPCKGIKERDPKELVSIIYTSGTTGSPKGVMHSFENFYNAVYNLSHIIILPENPRLFSYLPLSHIAERIGLEMNCILLGGSLTFPESIDTFADNLEQCQPDLFFAVPRIYAKFREKILEKIPQNRLNFILNLPLINRLIRKKLRAKLGLSKAKYIASGAAPLSVNILRWYKRMGIEIIQAYGMTEDCIISHCNLPGRNKIGTVGQFTYGAKAKLSEIGEICVFNNCLTLGYYKDPEATKALFDEDGYLKTGDVGEYDHEGYLTITGRAKDQFKTDKGKYISPGPIELELSKNDDIEQVCIVGMGIPHPIMLVVPSAKGKLKTRDELNQSLLNSILDINPTLEKHEKIEKAVVMKEDWTIDNGLMTPTLKIKRSQVEKIHLPMYRNWFEADEKVIYEA